MEVFYSDMDLPEDNCGGIFLAGPTPRDKGVQSWRPHALLVLKNMGYKGRVYIPEHKNPLIGYDYTIQIEWEHRAIKECDCLLFWVPRELRKMPAMTTNVEFGMHYKEPKTVYGRPEWAEKCGYLDYCWEKEKGMPPKTRLEDTLKEAMEIVERAQQSERVTDGYLQSEEGKREQWVEWYADDMSWEEFDSKYDWCTVCKSYQEGNCICYAR